jgi:hypothetical protein
MCVGNIEEEQVRLGSLLVVGPAVAGDDWRIIHRRRDLRVEPDLPAPLIASNDALF